ncbi:MAG: hypothetical protein ACK4S2_07090 [Gemmobacter sp.]|uniref:hypothetical protein n=1 Tax=Gemmobacter sp. TaxID=1898957 RepID=UPI00391B431F
MTTRHPITKSDEAMLTEAVAAYTPRRDRLVQVLACILLDRYGYAQAVALTDQMSGAVSALHAARSAGRPDPGLSRRAEVRPAPAPPRPDYAPLHHALTTEGPDPWRDDLPTALVTVGLGAALALALVAGLAVAAFAAVDGVQAQLLRGAVEW